MCFDRSHDLKENSRYYIWEHKEVFPFFFFVQINILSDSHDIHTAWFPDFLFALTLQVVLPILPTQGRSPGESGQQTQHRRQHQYHTGRSHHDWAHILVQSVGEDPCVPQHQSPGLVNFRGGASWWSGSRFLRSKTATQTVSLIKHLFHYMFYSFFSQTLLCFLHKARITARTRSHATNSTIHNRKATWRTVRD